MGWRLIENAPRTEEHSGWRTPLLGTDGDYWYVMWWAFYHRYDEWAWCAGEYEADRSSEVFPTHWMPLPPLPPKRQLSHEAQAAMEAG